MFFSHLLPMLHQANHFVALGQGYTGGSNGGGGSGSMNDLVNTAGTSLAQIGTWVGSLGAVAAGAKAGYHTLMGHLITTDPQEQSHHSAGVRKALWGAGVLAAIGTLSHFASTFLTATH